MDVGDTEVRTGETEEVFEGMLKLYDCREEAAATVELLYEETV